MEQLEQVATTAADSNGSRKSLGRSLVIGACAFYGVFAGSSIGGYLTHNPHADAKGVLFYLAVDAVITAAAFGAAYGLGRLIANHINSLSEDGRNSVQ